MEKNKSKKKLKEKKEKEKKKKKSDKLDNVKVLITTPEILLLCIRDKKPFQFDPSFTTLALTRILTDLKYITPIIEALKHDHIVTHVMLDLSQLQKSDLKELVTCLSEFNRGVTNISLMDNNFEPDVVEAIIQILRANPRIKVVDFRYSASAISQAGVTQFFQNMQHFKFEELSLSSNLLAECSDECFEFFKSNRSIKAIKINGETQSLGKQLKALFDILIVNRIREYWHWGQLDQNYEEFREVLKANYLTKLNIQCTLNNSLNLGNISEALISNTSITDLTIRTNPLNWKSIEDILTGNKTIKRLQLSDVDMSHKKVSLLHLATNTTITDLTLAPCKGLKYDLLFLDLCKNQTIRRLEVGSTMQMDGTQLRKFLEVNHSLRELKIDPDPQYYGDKTILAMSEGLIVNKTLRKLTIRIPRIDHKHFTKFIYGLKRNDTLLELRLGKIRDLWFENSPSNGNSADDFFLDLLKTNKTLRYIEGASEYPYLEDKLKQNRDNQDQIIRNTCMLIKMIVARAASFILPIEIWMEVFEYVSYSFSDIDFSEILSSLMNKT